MQGSCVLTDNSRATSSDNTNELSYYMGQIVKAAAQALSDTNKWLFNGSDSSVADLFRVIDDGKVMEDTTTTSDLDMQQWLEQSIYTVLIPYAWSLSNKNSHPFVMDTGYDCSDTYPDYFHDYISEDVAKATAVCYNDNLYYLVDARDCQRDCLGAHEPGTEYCTPIGFSQPFGIDSMDGTQWGGITIENLTISYVSPSLSPCFFNMHITSPVLRFNLYFCDLILYRRAINGYTGNNNANGWTYLDPTSSSDMEKIWDSGINAGGVVNIPVCSMSTAYTNWVECSTDADSYPCQS